MKIIISPAKKMKMDDSLAYRDLPVFLKRSEQLKKYIQSLNFAEKKELFQCSDTLVRQAEQYYRQMNLTGNLTPAILSYDGIQYQMMAPDVFEQEQFDYVQTHLRILSGFYGVLKPMDGVCPYRLEMQSQIDFPPYNSLYDFWGDALYHNVLDEDRIIINLASKEYEKCIRDYLKMGDHMITCTFGEAVNNKVVQKGVYVKMARGQMVRYLAEHQIKEVEQIKHFNEDGYCYRADLSDCDTYVFTREPKKEEKNEKEYH